KIWHGEVTNQQVVNPPVAAIQTKTWRDIESVSSLMISCGRSCHFLLQLGSSFTNKLGRLQSCIPRNCQTCSIGERPDDRVSQQITFHPLTHCVNAVCLSTTIAGSGRLHMRISLVISIETESGFIAEDHTPPVDSSPVSRGR
ncbi:hypothetical protein TNCV_3320901, partial [Trichonephila clavipes]